MTDYNRIVVTQDIRSADGTLKVEKGAVGTIRSRDQGYVGVMFDDGQDVYIKPGFAGRLIQEVPFIDTRPVDGY